VFLFGQATARLSGDVVDRSGAAVPGVEVTVLNVNTGNERKVITDEAGAFAVPSLAPGDYTVTVTKQGFRQAKREGVRLEVNQAARLDFSLELGAVTETVEVVGAVPLIDSDTSSIGQVIETKAIEDLPLNGRNFVQLAILGPGVVGVGFGAKGTIMSGTRPDDLRPGSELFSNGNRETRTTSSWMASTTTSASRFRSLCAHPSKPCANSRFRRICSPLIRAVTRAQRST
jgi:hypothetical protein